MSRPVYENSETKLAEGEVVSVACDMWRVDAVKMAWKYRGDFLLERDSKVVAMAEIKDRTCGPTIPYLIMSVEKVALAKLYCSEMNIPFFAIFRFNDGSMKYARIDNQKFDVEINGRNDRNDKDDIEPVIKITKSHLRPFVRREARAAA